MFVWFGAARRRRRGRTKAEQGKYSFNGFFTALRCFLCLLSGLTALQEERADTEGDAETVVMRETEGLKPDPTLRDVGGGGCLSMSTHALTAFHEDQQKL